MPKRWVAATLSSLFLLAPLATAQGAGAGPPPGRIRLLSKSYSLVTGVNLFVPAARATREDFDSTDWSPQLRLWRFDAKKGASFDFDLVWRRFGRRQNAAQFLGAGAGIRLRLTEPSRAAAPYLALHAGPHFADTAGRGLRARAGANLEAGLSVGARTVVALRYDFVDRIDGYDLSGCSLRVLIKVF